MPFPNQSTQFKPGWEGGPGRPKKKGLITDEAVLYLMELHPKHESKTRARVIAERWVERAENGKDLDKLLDRVDGKLPDPEVTPELTMEAVAEMEAVDGNIGDPPPAEEDAGPVPG